MGGAWKWVEGFVEVCRGSEIEGAGTMESGGGQWDGNLWRRYAARYVSDFNWGGVGGGFGKVNLCAKDSLYYSVKRPLEPVLF